jgi:predicted permease
MKQHYTSYMSFYSIPGQKPMNFFDPRHNLTAPILLSSNTIPMDLLLADFRHSFRVLGRNLTFTLAATLALALGIGANTAIFSVVNAVLLKPLPYASPQNLVVVLHGGNSPVSPADFLDWRAQARSFQQLGAAQAWGGVLSGFDHPEMTPGLQMSGNMFGLLGVAPFRGRTITPDDARPGAEAVIVLSYGLWRSKLGADPAILGRTLLVDGNRYTVVGIMPEGFQFAPFWMTKAAMWAPLILEPRPLDRGGRSLRVFGRLKNGVDLRTAQAEIDGICARLAKEYPKTNAKLTATVLPLQEKVVGSVRPTLIALLCTVGFVLLIACANVANLMLARSTARQREIAVRAALGATRARLIRMLLTESAILAILGGIAGLALAAWGVKILLGVLPPGSLPRQFEVHLDGAALAFTLLISILTGVVAGIVPGLQASRANLNDALKEGGRGGESIGRKKTRGMLVACETALALVLLMGAGLMVRSFMRLQAIDTGFDPRHVLSMVVSVAGTQDAEPGRRSVFYDQLIAKLEALPGVQSVSAINHLPVGGDLWGRTITILGRPLPAPGDELGAVYRVVKPNYFQTMRIPLLAGRDFRTTDARDSARVAIINETMAKRRWPGESPIGKRITMIDPMEIVGVSKNAAQSDLWGTPDDEVYLPFAQSADYTSSPAGHYKYLTFVVRTSTNPQSLTAAAQNTVWSLDHAAGVTDVLPMETVLTEKLWRQRITLWLFSIFAAVALVLAVTGIYAVVTQGVAERQREFGIRMALGASPERLLRTSILNGMQPVIAGTAAGIIMAFAGARWMESLLFGVKTSDLTSLASSVAVLLIAAMAANYLPARRAANTDPIKALRQD